MTMLTNIIMSVPTVVIVFYLAFINPHLLPLQTHEIVPICMQAAIIGFLAATMFSVTEKRFAIIGMLMSFTLLISGFLAQENIEFPFFIANNIPVPLNLRITCIILGALGAIRCWYGFRKPTEVAGKAETAFEFINRFFD